MTSSRYPVKAIGQEACLHPGHHFHMLSLLFYTFFHHGHDSRTGLQCFWCKDELATQPHQCITTVEIAGISPWLDHWDPHSPHTPVQEAPATWPLSVGVLPFSSWFVPRNSWSKLAFQLPPLTTFFCGRGRECEDLEVVLHGAAKAHGFQTFITFIES